MPPSSQDKLVDTALSTTSAVSQLPVVRVDRERFLRETFKDSPHIEVIVKEGPPAVFTSGELRKQANRFINSSTRNSSFVSFASGLPSNPIVMVPAGGADVAQYFGFALRLAQQLAYLFGEDDLLSGDDSASEEAQIRLLALLGTMMGASGASALLASTSKIAGQNIGKKVASQALTKTTWYPLLKKTGAIVGQKITRKTVEKTIAKAVPIIGGVISGGLTYATFRPLGHRLADSLEKGLNGELKAEPELNPEFVARMKKDEENIIDHSEND
ncbi:hypothetical protein [Corynebacterium falsenii]|uniref:hypothetical protein n=1 Tax=Corynebacterium falsenii TaxID=108486 RepID=UPI003FD11C64